MLIRSQFIIVLALCSVPEVPAVPGVVAVESDGLITNIHGANAGKIYALFAALFL